MLACPFEPISADHSACPACGFVGIPVIGTFEGRPNPVICLGCGHIFFPVLGGRGRNLTAEEKRWMRDVDARHGGRGKRHQESVVAGLWG